MMVLFILPTERSQRRRRCRKRKARSVSELQTRSQELGAQTSRFNVLKNAVVTISERPELGIVGMGVGVSERLDVANAIPDETVVVRGEENRSCWGRGCSPRSRRSSKTRYRTGG